MLNEEQKVKIKLLYESGESIKGIARKLGISKNTVKSILRNKPKESVIRESKLDNYKEYLYTKIKQANYSNSRLYREIKSMGYDGSEELVKKYLQPYRSETKNEITMRFETLPGQQAQADWKKMGLINFKNGLKKHVSCFSIVLGYSRDMFNKYYFSENLENCIDGHIEAFKYFGGVVHEILYDQMKQVLLEEYSKNVLKWNKKFKDFADYYGFNPIVCRPYWPRTKGKVEKPNQYIERDFFLGRSFYDLDDMNRQAIEWLNTVANVRVHGTTNEIPVIRLEDERKCFIILPQKEYVCYREELRKAAKDCYISFDGNRYSLPHEHVKVKRQYLIKSNNKELFIYHDKKLIAQHKLSIARNQMITNPEHFKGIVKKPNNIELQRIYGEFTYMGEVAKKYLASMKEAKINHLTWNVKKILELVNIFTKQEVLVAMEHAIKFEAYGYQYIRNICQKNEKRGPEGLSSAKEILANVFKKFNIPSVEIRDLSTYDKITENSKNTTEKGHLIGGQGEA